MRMNLDNEKLSILKFSIANHHALRALSGFIAYCGKHILVTCVICHVVQRFV